MSLLHSVPPSTRGRRIFIALPTYGPLPALTSFSLFKSHAALNAVGFDVELCILEGHCHVDDGRNILVQTFMDSQCDELLFIDADIGWQPDQLVRFVQHDRDMVSAIYPKKDDTEDYPCQLIAGELWTDNDGLMEVTAVPTGFLKIKRSVFEHMAAISRKYKPDSQARLTVSEWFYRDIVGGNRVSGDYNFCRRWKAEGGTIFIDPEMFLDHVGQKVWSGKYGSFLRRNNGIALTQGLQRIAGRSETTQDIIDLWAEWGNPFSAGHELLWSVVDIARRADGPIVEIGSGLTSLAMAATGAEVHAIEHDPAWFSRVSNEAQRLGLHNLHIHHTPLVQHPEGRWYGETDAPWRDCDVLLCDGPPHKLGNRSILYRVMRENDAQPRVFVQDDMSYVPSALEALPYQFEVVGSVRPFVVGKTCQSQSIN